MASTLMRTISLGDGDEINLYQDADGYHAERWSEAKQLIVSQSGDCETEEEAVGRVSD